MEECDKNTQFLMRLVMKGVPKLGGPKSPHTTEGLVYQLILQLIKLRR